MQYASCEGIFVDIKQFKKFEKLKVKNLQKKL